MSWLPVHSVVEDDASSPWVCRKKLTKLGYDAWREWPRARRRWSSEARRPDLVLMDIRLEGPLDGVEAPGRSASVSIFRRFLDCYSNQETLERAKITEPYGTC